MKDAVQLIREYVLRSISDDYEEIETILPEVTHSARESGIAVDRRGVLSVMEELIREGFAHAHMLSTKPPYSTVVKYTPEDVDDLWFYVTPRGKELVLQTQKDIG